MTDRTGAPPAEAAATVGVLGPLTLVVGDEVVEVPGPKRRALLAMLAVAGGRAVPVDDLLAALWPSDPPGSARATLQSHVSRLRRHLGPAADRLEGVPGAYRLHLGPEDTDVGRARSLLAAAAGSAAVTDPSAALGLLREARALWRGEPLAEFGDVEPLTAVAVGLRGLRGAVDEAYADAALAAGEISDALEVATGNARAQPLSEPAALLMMRALHAAGRSADALRAGYEHRRRLATEAGLEPTSALGALEAEIASTTVVPAGAVPRSTHRLRGRDSELAAVRRLLGSERLVTVLGPGGVGKTRLASAVAATAEPVTALLLASVTDGPAVPHALAAALDLRVTRGDPLGACAALLAAGPHLLLVDNCEHLLDAVRNVVSTLLDACPELTVLATSREPLGLPDEQRFRLAPLSLARPVDLDDLDRTPAVAVFVDRARRVDPDFAPGADDLGLITAIAGSLDGLPLAIELAAGRIASLGLVDLHARLDRALELLDSGDGALTRTIAWSYDLLPDHERRLLRHLSAFPDGVDLATAESVAGGLGLGPSADRALAHLVEASMVEVDHGPTTRYRFLDTVRSFAHAQLEADGEDDAATERFLGWALDLADWVGPTIESEQEARADQVLRQETANLRAAWGIIRAEGRLDDAVRLVTGLYDASGWRDLSEVWGWALELAGDPDIEHHPAATAVDGIAAASAWARGELDAAGRLARRGLDRGGPDRWRCLSSLAMVALTRGELAAAMVHGTEAGRTAAHPDQSFGVAALAAAYGGDLETAAELNDRLAEVAVFPSLVAMHHYVAGEIEAVAGRAGSAAERYEQAIDLGRASGSTFVQGIAAVGLLTTRAASGHVAEALTGYRDLIAYWERTGGWVQQWTTLRNLARLLRSLDDEATAAFLDAAADAAPDAPALGAADAHRADVDGPDAMTEEARSASRTAILEVARQAITAQLAAFGSWQPRGAHASHGLPVAPPGTLP